MIPLSVLVPLFSSVIAGVFGVIVAILSQKLRGKEPSNSVEWKEILKAQEDACKAALASKDEVYKAALAAKDETIRLWRADALSSRSRFDRLEQSTQRIVNLAVPSVSSTPSNLKESSPP